MAVQWLGLSGFTAISQVQSLVRELRSRKLGGETKKKKKKKTTLKKKRYEQNEIILFSSYILF